MSTTLQRPVAPAAALRPARRSTLGVPKFALVALAHLFSFEMVLVLYIYSNFFQALLPPLPVDSTVVFFLLSIGFGGLVVLREGIYLRGFHLVVAFLPYLLWAALSLAWTPSRQFVYDSLQLHAVVNLWMLVAGAMVIAPKRQRMARFLALCAVLSLVVALIGLWIYFTYGSFKYAGWDVRRAYNEWGRAVANGAVVLLILFLRSRFGSARQLLFGGLLGLCALFIFVGSSRSALLVLAVPALLFMAVNFAPFGQRGIALSRAQLLLLMVVAAVATAVTVLISSGYQIDTVNRLLKVFRQAENTDLILGANRFVYYDAALRYFAQSPLIGHGLASFSMVHRGIEMEGIQPHNIFLELLAETGVVGFAAFGFFLYVALRPLTLRRLRSDPVLLCAAMLFVGRFTAAMFGQELPTQNILFLTIGLLALRPSPAPVAAAADEGQEEAGAPRPGEAAGMWPGRDIRPGIRPGHA
jgi:O-antigen ligase